jgi:hypothetical protein
MLLTLPCGWLTRLDGDFFAVDYQITDATRDADDNLRHLMRQLLVIELVNHQSRYRLEANRWLSEIALLLATRYTRPVIAGTARRRSGAAALPGWWRGSTPTISSGFRCTMSPPPNLSPKPGCRACFARCRRKFLQYITALRLNNAAEQLLTTRKSVQQIARSKGSPAPAS